MFKAELSYWNISLPDQALSQSGAQSSSGALPKVVHTHLNNSFRNQYPDKAENLEPAVDKNNISYIDEDTDIAYNSVQIDPKMSVPKPSARNRTSQGTF